MATSGWFGHPRGLSTLFFTEMWERFSYYGMRAFLILYMTAPIAAGGLGFDDRRAGSVYGTYTGSVWLAAIGGGGIADRFLGAYRSVLWGGAIIALGHFTLAFENVATFYAGLALIVVGKPMAQAAYESGYHGGRDPVETDLSGANAASPSPSSPVDTNCMSATITVIMKSFGCIPYLKGVITVR